MFTRITISFLLLASLIPSAMSQEAAPAGLPYVSPMFGSHMVLQRGIKVPVWGWTAPGSPVSVTIDGNVARAVAGADGRWEAKIGPMEAGGPYTLTISGPETTAFDDVLVGDVWMSTGQSNAEMGIMNVQNADQEVAEANYPQIRLYNVSRVPLPEPRISAPGEWLVCTPENIKKGPWGGFSAIGYFFGRDLQRELNVPIGLIQDAWGGTPAEAWTSREALIAHVPDYRPIIAGMDEALAGAKAGAGDYATQVEAYITKSDPGSKAVPGWQDPSLDDSGWKTMQLPSNWEKAGLPDFDGIVWFRKVIDLPADAAGKDAVLHIGAVDDADATYVNGVRVGGVDDYSLARVYNVPGSALRAGRNVIAVRVMDFVGDGGLMGPAAEMHLDVTGGAPVAISGPWQYKVGIAVADMAGVRPQKVEGNPGMPTMLFNGMIAPVIPFAIKGAIWYQGEGNADRAFQYRTLLPTMISDWRKRWGLGDFPFVIVQLAAFLERKAQPSDDTWAELREAQDMTASKMKNVGIATAIDIGNATDIHPKNKQEVGRRLALVALARTYGKDVPYSGPVYKSMKVENSAIRLRFTHLDGGLVAKDGRLGGFAIAGEDRKFVWADAAIDGETVVVSEPTIPKPVAVRYAWDANPEVTLYNQAGLPALPFRTDQWPGITQPKPR